MYKISVDQFDDYSLDQDRALLNDTEVENALYQGSLLNGNCQILDCNCCNRIKYSEILLILISNRILRGNNSDCWVDEKQFFDESEGIDLHELANEMLEKISCVMEEDFVDKISSFSEHYSHFQKCILKVSECLKNQKDNNLLSPLSSDTLNQLKKQFGYFYELLCQIYNTSDDIREWERSIQASEYRDYLNSCK